MDFYKLIVNFNHTW